MSLGWVSPKFYNVLLLSAILSFIHPSWCLSPFCIVIEGLFVAVGVRCCCCPWVEGCAEGRVEYWVEPGFGLEARSQSSLGLDG